MRPEERGPHLQRHAFADAADDAQHLQLVPGRKAVAALDLHAPRTHRRDLAHALHRLRIEFVLRSLVQPVGGVENAPAPPGDLLVRQTVDLVQKLPLAAPGVDQVGVRVAERREEHAPAASTTSSAAMSPRESMRPNAAKRPSSASSHASSSVPSLFMSAPQQRRRPVDSMPTMRAMFFTSSLIGRGGIGRRLRYGDTSPRRCR